MKAIEKTEVPSSVANIGTEGTTVYVEVDMRKKRWLELCEKELALKARMKEIRDEKRQVEEDIAANGGLPQLIWDFGK
mgnify:CR=1 FL=1